MKTLNKSNKINLAIIAVALTVLVALAVNQGFITYEELKYAAGFVLMVLGYFYQSFGKWEAQKENRVIKRDFEKKVGVSHDEFKMIKNK